MGLAMQLSPFNIAEIKFRAGMAANKPEPRKKPKCVEMYVCSECGEMHYSEEEAEDCCSPEEAGPHKASTNCPICGDPHRDHYATVDCCLWKDLDIATRLKVAAAVESGTDWITALDIK